MKHPDYTQELLEIERAQWYLRQKCEGQLLALVSERLTKSNDWRVGNDSEEKVPSWSVATLNDWIDDALASIA